MPVPVLDSPIIHCITADSPTSRQATELENSVVFSHGFQENDRFMIWTCNVFVCSMYSVPTSLQPLTYRYHIQIQIWFY